ncbi:MAG: hypothetical protein HYU41_24130 [Candidatus Rokubacteria bacterium]|nr:hypothetical protein [Candidatus Rokubacteria bacterium]
MARLALVVLLAWCATGCAAIPLVPLGAAAMSGSANSLTRAGAEMTMGGGVLRTFTLPFDDTHAAAYATLRRLGVKVYEEERTEAGMTIIRGQAYGRAVTMTLEAVTPVMTRVRTDVRAGLVRDRATAAEIVAQTERAIESRASVRANR